MIIKTNSGHSAFNTTEICAIHFEVKFKTIRKGFKKILVPIQNEKGEYLIDKTKISILFKNGQYVNLICSSEQEGQRFFDTVVNSMI